MSFVPGQSLKAVNDPALLFLFSLTLPRSIFKPDGSFSMSMIMKIFILYPSVGQREILNHRNVSIGRDHSFKIYPGDKFWPFSGLSVSKRGLYERSVVVAQGQMDSNYKRGDLD